MAETPSVPPTGSSASSSAGVSSTTPASSVKPVGLSNLTIEHAPQHLTSEGQNRTLEGTVIYSNPEKAEIRIYTQEGEITVKSSEHIPHGTKVLLKLHKLEMETFVNIIIIEQGGKGTIDKAITSEIQKPDTPVIKEGQRLTATLIKLHQQKALTALINDLNSITKEDLLKLNLPLDKAIIDKIISNFDIKNILSTLPEQKFNEVLSILISHINTTKLKAKHPSLQHKLQTAYKTEQTPAQNNQTTLIETSDQDVLQALYNNPATVKTKTTTPPSAVDTKQEITMQSLQETIQTKSLKASASGKLSLKKYHIDIIKIIPADMGIEQINNAIKTAVEETINSAAKYHTPEYTALPLQVAQLDNYTHKGLNVLKTLDIENPLNFQNSINDQDVRRFAIEQPLSINKESIIIFKAVPLETNLSIQGQAATITPSAQNEILDKNFITRENWPALEETIRVLNETSPEIAQNIKNSLITPTAKLVPTTLFLMAALRLGSIENWLGGNILKNLRSAGRKELADMLSSDFTRMSNLSKEPIADEWRPFSLPFINEDKANQLQMYIREQYEKENSEGKEPKKFTRFILNLNLSRMGQMQLDGTTNKKNLDIIIRTEKKLSFSMRQDIMKSFSKGIEHVNMQGHISFQTKSQEWIEIDIPDNDILRV